MRIYIHVKNTTTTGIVTAKLPNGMVRLAETLVRSYRYWKEINENQAIFGLKPMNSLQETKCFAICICNESYEASLEKRKLYEVLDDSNAARHHQIRVIDESGEDYLYPENYFLNISLPQAIEHALAEAA